MLDSKAIETLSVNAVRNSIVICPILDQFIPDNDKEPSWDGNVYIYNSSSKTKDNLKGRLPVQVKGTENNDFLKEKITFSMETADLKNYLYDGGCMLFVVYVSSDGMSNKIYYAQLVPVKLRMILAQAGDQKTKTVELNELPADINKRGSVFLSCLQNCQKQKSILDVKLYSLDELEKGGLIESITIPLSAMGEKDPIEVLLNSEVYMYAKIKGTTIPQPLEMLSQSLYTKEDVSQPVTVNGIKFYDGYSRIKSKKETTVKIGSSFQITFPKDESACKINYENSNKLRIIAKDLKFFLACLDAGQFEINGAVFPMHFEAGNFNNFDREQENQRLEFYCRAVQSLDILHCDSDLNIDELSEENLRNLNRLSIAFVDGEEVRNLRKDIPFVATIDIGPLKFALVFDQSKENEGSYRIYDFFTKEQKVAFENENGEMIPTSQYSIIQAKDMITLSNIRTEVLLPSFQAIKNREIYERANWFLLELLDAYDQSGRDDFLTVAHDFASWLIKSVYIDEYVSKINYYQVIKRTRALNIMEQTELWGMLSDSSTPRIGRVGIYILLEQWIPAMQEYTLLSKKDKDSFVKFPIIKLWSSFNVQRIDEKSNL